MTSYLFRILVGIKAFAFGVFIVYLIALSNPPAEVCFITYFDSKTVKNTKLDDEIKFVFKQFIKDGDNTRAEFVLVNNSSESIQYMGYDKGSYCTVDYKEKGKIKMSPACCGTGLQKQTLNAGDEQSFTVFLFDWKYVDQVGFKFSDSNGKLKVIWSDRFLVK